MSKGLPDLMALVAEVQKVVEAKPKDVLETITKVSTFLDWLETNGWTLEDLNAVVKTGISLWAFIGPLVAKKPGPQ